MATDATDQLGRDLAVSGPVSNSRRAAQDVYSPFESMPPLPALKSLTKLGNDLLQRTAELPDTEQGLLLVLAEYRYAVFTFVAVTTRIVRSNIDRCSSSGAGRS